MSGGGGAGVIARVLSLAWLVAVWVALWGTPTAGTAAAGALVGVALLALLPLQPRPTGAVRVRPLPALRALVIVGWKVLAANVVVAREVLSPGRKQRNEGIVAVPVAGASEFVLSVLAATLSVAPGTLIIATSREPAVLYVHVFHLRSVEQVRLDVLRLERVLLRAIGSAESCDDCDARIAALEAAEATT